VDEPPYTWKPPQASTGLFIADSTALSAWWSILDSVDLAVTALVVEPLADRESIPVPTGENISLTWVDELTEKDLLTASAGLDPRDCYVWAAGERQIAKTVREFVRSRFPVPRQAMHVHTYWIAGY
jgi:NADPH-dependent ferric siderophore reductase